MNRIAKGLAALGLLALVALGSSCSLYRNDRAYVPKEQYSYARDLFIQTGSLDLVERQLKQMEWTPGKINETIYRLQKEFQVLPEELPAQPAAATPQSTPAP